MASTSSVSPSAAVQAQNKAADDVLASFLEAPSVETNPSSAKTPATTTADSADGVAGKTLNRADTSASGTAEQEEAGFNSYGNSAVRWTWDAVKPHHDNLVKRYNLPTVRRLFALVVGSIGAVLGYLADCVRGIGYNLRADRKLHNDGTTPLKAYAARAFQWLQPTRDVFKASARNIAEAFEKAGRAVDGGKLNEPFHNPNAILDKAFKEEAAALAPRLAGLESAQIRKSLDAFKAELEKYTANAPDFYPEKGRSTLFVNKVEYTMVRIREALANTDEFANLVAAAGNSDQSLSRLVKDLETAGAIPPGSGADGFRGKVNEAAETLEEQETAKKAQAEQERQAEETAKKNEAANAAAKKQSENRQATVKKAEEEARTQEAQKAAAVSEANANFDIAIGLLNQVVALQGQVLAKYDGINADLDKREKIIGGYVQFKKDIIALMQEKGYKLEAILDAMIANDDDTINDLRAAVQPLKDMREEMNNTATVKRLHDEIKEIVVKIREMSVRYTDAARLLPDEHTVNALGVNAKRDEIFALRGKLEENAEALRHRHLFIFGQDGNGGRNKEVTEGIKALSDAKKPTKLVIQPKKPENLAVTADEVLERFSSSPESADDVLAEFSEAAEDDAEKVLESFLEESAKPTAKTVERSLLNPMRYLYGRTYPAAS